MRPTFTFAVGLLVAGALWAQSVNLGQGGMQAWFRDGTGIEIHTESTGPTKISSSGQIGIGPGDGSEDLINRVVIDSAGNFLFAYNLEGSRGKSLDTVTIRIEPISAATERDILQQAKAAKPPKFSGAHVPTVAAVREFPSVGIGEFVRLEILYNPSTGERIYDVFRPIMREAISLKNIMVTVNGKGIMAPPSSMTAAAVRIDIPDHGAYVLAIADPKHVQSLYTFQAIAAVDGRRLSWEMDGDKIEIISKLNVLTQAVKGSLWIYHDAQYRSQDLPNSVGVRAADGVEWLIPRKR